MVFGFGEGWIWFFMVSSVSLVCRVFVFGRFGLGWGFGGMGVF